MQKNDLGDPIAPISSKFPDSTSRGGSRPTESPGRPHSLNISANRYARRSSTNRHRSISRHRDHDASKEYHQCQRHRSASKQRDNTTASISRNQGDKATVGSHRARSASKQRDMDAFIIRNLGDIVTSSHSSCHRARSTSKPRNRNVSKSKSQVDTDATSSRIRSVSKQRDRNASSSSHRRASTHSDRSTSILPRSSSKQCDKAASNQRDKTAPRYGVEFNLSGISKDKSSRKRKLSKESHINKIKKMKIDKPNKSFEKEKRILEKKVEKKYSASCWNKMKNKSKPGENGLVSKKASEKQFKDEYTKRLTALARFGKNFYCPSMKKRSGLRPVYIDGSNVALSHGQKQRFSVQGLKICIDYFRKRGHEVKAFIPQFRLKKGESTDQELLHKLVTQKLVITTPTLYIQNKRRSPYDDWYIVQSAAANGGIIVSADNFHDIVKWNPNLRAVIEERRLVPTFVDDMLIFPVDPHGNRQNNLEQFLSF